LLYNNKKENIMTTRLTQFTNAHPKSLTARYLEKAVTGIQTAQENGELIKKEYKDINEALNRVIYAAYDSHTGTKHMILSNSEREERQGTFLDKLYWDSPDNGVGLAKFKRLLDTISKTTIPDIHQPMMEFTIAVTDELIALREQLLPLKDKIVVKRKAVVEKEQAVQRKLSHDDVTTTKKHLGGVIESIHEEVVAANKRAILARYEIVKNALIADDLTVDATSYRRNDDYKTQQKHFTYSERLGVSVIDEGRYLLKDKHTLGQQADKLAERIYQDLKTFYITRISQKVAPILSHKNNLADIVTLDLQAHQQIEAALQFQFKDNSQFNLSTKVEWAALPSDHSKAYMRVPTRFHALVTPDGKQHTQLSQEVVEALLIDNDNTTNNKTPDMKKTGKRQP
jgi:hypothetical protein